MRGFGFFFDPMRALSKTRYKSRVSSTIGHSRNGQFEVHVNLARESSHIVLGGIAPGCSEGNCSVNKGDPRHRGKHAYSSGIPIEP